MIDVSDYKPRRITSPTWRECLKKIWDVDPLECPKCHGEMKIISFIVERKVIRRILVHLKLWDDPQRQRPPPSKKNEQFSQVSKKNVLHYEPFDDGWGDYQEPFFKDD